MLFAFVHTIFTAPHACSCSCSCSCSNKLPFRRAPFVFPTLIAVHKRSRNIPEDQRIIVLTALITNKTTVTPIRWSEPILPYIRNPRGHMKKKSLYCNDINRVDHPAQVHISSRHSTSGKQRPNHEEMSLNRYYVDGVDSTRTRSQRSLARGDRVIAAGNQR